MDNNGFVFIDGSNFYFKLRDLTSKFDAKISLLNFDFAKFAKWLAGDNNLIGICYYIGALRRQVGNVKSEQMYNDQQKLFRKLQKQGAQIALGQLIRHPDKSYHEKGVDVQLAVEMIRFARQDRYDIAYLVSSDTDLAPAVEEVKALGKRVQYVGTANGQSFGLSVVSDDVRLLRVEDIEPFLPKFLL